MLAPVSWPATAFDFGDPLLLVLERAADGDAMRIGCTGELDMATADQVDGEIRGLLAGGFTTITLDLRRLRFIDCCGLRMLLELNGCAAEAGGRLELAYAEGPVQRLLELTRTAGEFARAA
jgi:anti-anti-sigma factor